MVAILERRFRSTGEDLARPQHLDANLLATPAVAMDALGMELRRMGAIATGNCLAALEDPQGRGPRLEAGRQVLESLQAAAGEYSAGIHHRVHDPALDARLPHALRVAQYHVNLAELAPELARLRPQAHLEVDGPARLLQEIRDQASALLRAGSAGEVSPRRMAVVLEYGSILRRICGQAAKATVYLDRYLEHPADAGDAAAAAAAPPG